MSGATDRREDEPVPQTCIGEVCTDSRKNIVKTELGTQDVAQYTVDNIIQCLNHNGNGELLEEL